MARAFKATFGYHVYDHAQAADMLGERLEQLRSGRERDEEAEAFRRWLLVAVGLFGAALLYGDGMITPAISVLSAVEGLKIVTPASSAA